MFKKITATMLSVAIPIVGFAQYSDATLGTTTTSEAYIPSETIQITLDEDERLDPIEQLEIEIVLEGNFLDYVETNDFTELQNLLKECETRKENASQMANAARDCGYEEDHPVIKLAQAEWTAANDLAMVYQEKIDETKWAKAWKEYPVATQVWIYLTKTMGYNNYVTAGIMGNMMIECGGWSLKLDWTAVNKSSKCYGLCQWHPLYHKEVQGGDLQAQLDYAYKSFPEVLSRYAFEYKKGFTYQQFLALTDAREAAKAFCLIYERPGGYNPARGDLAIKAYDYFVN